MHKLCCYGYTYYINAVWMIVHLKAWQADQNSKLSPAKQTKFVKSQKTYPNNSQNGITG